jgi:hypothetical protein
MLSFYSGVNTGGIIRQHHGPGHGFVSARAEAPMITWIMAAITFREAARKKILWTALLAGVGFLIVFGIGLRIQIADFGNETPAFVRYQILSGVLMVRKPYS